MRTESTSNPTWTVSWTSRGWRGQHQEHSVPCDSHDEAVRYAQAILAQDGNTGVSVHH